MVFIHAHLVGGSWGLAIVGLTVLIRAILVPLTFRQLKSMQEMQRLAPQMNALKEKYKEDKQRQQQEIMKFYQENKINPLASCLPLLLQLPVFISLFYMLRTDLKKHICGTAAGRALQHALRTSRRRTKPRPRRIVAHLPSKFVERTRLQHGRARTRPSSCSSPTSPNKATGVALIVLIVLYVGSQLASTLIATATADPNQRRLMLLLPVVFVVILYRYPAGLLVYWITTNLWTIGQQYLIRGDGCRRPRHRLPPVNGKPSRSLRQAIADAAGGGGGATSPAPEPAVAPAGVAAVPPPRPPRKKKKRSGRRR